MSIWSYERFETLSWAKELPLNEPRKREDEISMSQDRDVAIWQHKEEGKETLEAQAWGWADQEEKVRVTLNLYVSPE